MKITGFNEVIHSSKRLQICALLFSTKEVEFKTIKEILDVSDSVLSKHIKILQNAGYAKQKKYTSNGRAITWVTMTTDGKKVFTAHVEALKKIVGSE